MSTPHVAIVVPFHREPASEITQCLASIRLQSVKAQIIAVPDEPSAEAMAAARVQLRESDRLLPFFLGAHRDYGNFARSVGAVQAVHEGAAAIGFLDADNWLAPDHVERLLELGTPVATATRTLCRVDGSRMYLDAECDGAGHVDTSCLFLRREAFGLLPAWGLIPRELASKGDRVFWQLVSRFTKQSQRRHCTTSTVFYRTRYALHYRNLGETPPPTAKELEPLTPGTYTIGAPFSWTMEIT